MYYTYFLGFYYSEITNTASQQYPKIYNNLDNETYYLNLDNDSIYLCMYLDNHIPLSDWLLFP